MNNLAQRDTLLYLAMAVSAWAIPMLSICWWQGLIGATFAALLIGLRYQMKIEDSAGVEPEPVEPEPAA